MENMEEKALDLVSEKLSAPEVVQYMEDRANRTFYLDSYIDESYICVEIAKNIISLNMKDIDKDEKDLEPIKLFIYSYGGDITQAFMLCDVIASSRIPVYTIAMGAAMSSGFIVFLAGHKRYAFSHVNMMLHYGQCQCDLDDLPEERAERARKNYEESMRLMKKYIMERTSISADVLEDRLQETWYVTAEEMMQYKIVDGIVGLNINPSEFYRKLHGI